MRRIAVAVCLAIGSASPAFAERVIVKCKQSCDPVVAAVQQDGGRVVQRFKYVAALVADVNDLSLPRTRALLDPGAIRKDLIVNAIDIARDPRGNTLVASAEALGAQPLDVDALAAPGAAPAAYAVNNVLTNVQPLHVDHFTGAGMKVALLDTGIRPGYPHLMKLDATCAPTLSCPSKVIGGEDFVNDGLGFSNPANNGHGTFTAGLIASNITFSFPETSAFLGDVRAECSTCAFDTGRTTVVKTPDGTLKVVKVWGVPMRGSAPDASIYAMRVLGPDGSGRQSWIIAGMERVIELREKFDAGEPETVDPDTGKYTALDIRVANMSLGGSTLFPGRDVEDELTNAFLEHDIVLVVAAGNNGPSGATVASPGSGLGSLTVGAASTPIHERILRDLQFGPGVGPFYRPFNGIQTAVFSSRGPNADGRPDPDLVANGFGSFGQGIFPANQITFASGTSASAPTVAGIAAVLRQAVWTATAREVRNALILTADPSLITDGSGPNDRGAGFVNADAARTLLKSGTAPDTPGAPGGTNKHVSVNLQQVAGIETFSGDVRRSTGALLPGQRFEAFYRVTPGTAAVIVTLSEVKTGVNQNVFFGDDVILTVHSAKMSAVPGLISDPEKPNVAGDYKLAEFTNGGRFVINRPEPGILRVTVNGDWINASPISGVISISSLIDPESGGHTAKNKIREDQTQAVPFVVPFGTKKLSLKAAWHGDWGYYPTNDLDVVLMAPDGTLNFDAATLSNPERAEISDPAAGKWIAFIRGFDVNSANGDKYTLQITADDVVIK